MIPRSTPATSADARRTSGSVRVRILGWYVILLGVSLVAALLVQRAFLLAQARSDAELAMDQEVGELRQLSRGINPETGEPFGTDVTAIFDTFFARNVPLAGEGLITFVDGQIYKTDVLGSTLTDLPEVDGWGSIIESERGVIENSELGEIRYLAVPLGSAEELNGVFVVAVLMSDRLASVDQAIRLGAAVYGSIFFLATVLAWAAAGRILQPLRDLTETARAITDTDISQRIEVEGDDEIAELASTFNAMLGRLDDAFAAERRFIDDAGHELQTPITVIRGNLELMGDDPEDREETVKIVTDELDRMSRIVDDLLDLAKAEQPDFIQPGPIDLDEFIRELVVKATALDDRPWHVERAEPAQFRADRHRLNQAMMNLARNAVEHTPAGTPVHVGGEIGGNAAVLWVRDEGPGIAEQDSQRIFERFSRAESARPRTEGAGLGLAIVSAIAEAHGGTVRAETPPEGGARFTLTIPSNGIAEP
jgi:two-component system, OmpR family, sensor kinase